MAKVLFVFVFLCVFSLVVGQFGFSPNHREDRRYGASFDFVNNFLPNSRRIYSQLSSALHLRPETQQSNQAYIYPFNNRPGISNSHYDQYGGPNYPRYNPDYQNHQGFMPQYESNQGYNQGFQPDYQNGPGFKPEYQNNQDFNPVNQNNQFQSNEGFNSEYQRNQGKSDAFPNPKFLIPESNVNQNQPELLPSKTEVDANHNFASNPETTTEQSSLIIVDLSTPRSESADPKDVLPIFGSAEGKQNIPSFEDRNGESGDVGFTPTIYFTGENKTKDEGDKTSGQGFPSFPPISIENPTQIPKLPPLSPVEETTTLPPLTPVPESEKRNNFNFGTQGLFKETCETPEGQVGSCISVYSCKPYITLLQQSRSNPGLVQLLRKAHCGFEGNNPKVCCPLPGIPTAPPTTTATDAPVTKPTVKSVQSGDYVSMLPEPPVCGVSNASFSRVVGGIPAKLGDFPWMALLGYKSKRNQDTNWLCGGSLITSKHVLTAAHCINGHEQDLYVVRLGELDLDREDEGATPVDVLIKSKIMHENYNANAYTDDIGILVLEKDVEFTDLIRPICLPQASELRAKSFENYNPLIAGWGDTEFRGPTASHLQVLQLPVVSNEFCIQAYAAYKKQKIDERVLCAGYKKGGKDACQGDSGGPLMQPIWNKQDFTTHFYQIGVVSYGKKCAEPGFPGVYSRITHFIPWLEQQLLGSA